MAAAAISRPGRRSPVSWRWRSTTRTPSPALLAGYCAAKRRAIALNSVLSIEWIRLPEAGRSDADDLHRNAR